MVGRHLFFIMLIPWCVSLCLQCPVFRAHRVCLQNDAHTVTLLAAWYGAIPVIELISKVHANIVNKSRPASVCILCMSPNTHQHTQRIRHEHIPTAAALHAAAAGGDVETIMFLQSKGSDMYEEDTLSVSCAL